MGYDYSIKYHSDNTNLVMDALSRRPKPTEYTLITFEKAKANRVYSNGSLGTMC